MGKSRSCAVYPSVGSFGFGVGWFGPFGGSVGLNIFQGKLNENRHLNFWVGPKRKHIVKPSIFSGAMLVSVWCLEDQ